MENSKINTEARHNFIINQILIFPIQDIINKLNANEFRECDNKWLHDRLDAYIKISAETLGIRGLRPQKESVKPKFLHSEYGIKYYLNYFEKLLKYFKTL